MNIESDITLVKDQLSFHEKQAGRFEGEPRRSERHRLTAARFQALLDDLQLVALALEVNPDLFGPSEHAPRLSLAWEELDGLPPEVLAELSISDSDKTEFLIQAAIRELGGVASLDRLIVQLFRDTGEAHKRTPLNQRLYRMSQKDMVFSVPGKKGVYSLRPYNEEEAAKLSW